MLPPSPRMSRIGALPAADPEPMGFLSHDEHYLRDPLGLDIFEPSDFSSFSDEPKVHVESASNPSSLFNRDWSSPCYDSNSLLLGTSSGSSADSLAPPMRPLHDSYFGDLEAPTYSLTHPPRLPRIQVDTESHNLTNTSSALDPRSPAFERSPTSWMPTPTSYTHSSPSISSPNSYPPPTPHSPYAHGDPFSVYIEHTSHSPLSPAELTVQPAALDQPAADYPVAPQHDQEEPHRVLVIAQQIGHPFAGELVPQPDYRPHTQSDRRRYVEQVNLDAPILFFMQNPTSMGIPLRDAISSRFMHLSGRDDPMFEGRGPSVSIRLNWPGYAPWSRQIPTRDFRSPPHPVTRAKLARNVAKTINRFIKEMSTRPMEDPSQARWRVGPQHIRLEDLLLVGLQHVSMGSWQAHVRLVRRH